jgi:hypothetical protein
VEEAVTTFLGLNSDPHRPNTVMETRLWRFKGLPRESARDCFRTWVRLLPKSIVQFIDW